ncbi:MAG TPA: phosphoglucosamine mutase [Thermosynechococcaceae cyanobacterium]
MVSSPIRAEKLSASASSGLKIVSEASLSLGIDALKGETTIASGKTGWGGLALPDRLFGTDGIRGKAGELLTAPLAMQVGFWAGQVLQQSATGQSPVIIGQDSRNSSSMLSLALSAGLTAAGLEVWNLGLCPTPGVANLTQQLGAIGGIMISASHNPPEDNGIKLFGSDGSKLLPELQAQIEAALRGTALNFPLVLERCGQHYYRPELVQKYLTTVQAPLKAQLDQPLQGMKVVLDLAWGAAAEVAPPTFAALGAEVICLHDRPDGDRINVNCGSTHLSSLQAAVQEHQADLGFAFDGDADRVLAVDAQGRMVDGDYILYLWGQALREQDQLPGDTIVATVMSNLGFERAWEQQGGKLVRAAVGDQHVHAEMLRHGSMLGGEQSGHILCPHYGVGGDGLMTALHLTALVQQAGGSLAALVDRSFQTYPQRLKNVRVNDRSRSLNWQDCEPLQQAIVEAEKDMGDHGRVLVRASGTEPLIRVMVEAATSELVNHWTETLAAIVERHLAVG